jgi:prepilin-type processing-associated H-X9-DG protein
MRQIGTALRMRIDENDDWLPPAPLAPNASVTALSESQGCVYSGTTSTTRYQKWLVYYLASYMNYPPPEESRTRTNVMGAFLCCGYLKGMPGASHGSNRSGGTPYDPRSDNFANAFPYSVTRTNGAPNARLAAAKVGYPFGKQNANNPVRYGMIQAAGPLSDMWAFADFDSRAVSNPNSLGDATDPTRETPSHGNSRNFLFWDFHVSAKKVSTPSDY